MNFVVLEINSREMSTILHRSSLSNDMKRRKILYWVFCNTSGLIEKVSLVTFNLAIELIYQWGQPMLKDLRFLMISILIFAPTVFQAVYLWVKEAYTSLSLFNTLTRSNRNCLVRHWTCMWQKTLVKL